MTLLVCAVRDVLNGFMAPMVEQSIQTAKRNFAFAINNNDVMGFSPKDFDLYRIGTYNSDTGVISALDLPEFICSGYSVFVNEKEGE